jgi:uncharacterized protein
MYKNANKIILSKAQARRFLIAYHGLDREKTFSGKEGILRYISRVGCIQYDPLNVVGQNPELVLQSRIQGFERSMLKELLYSDFKLIDIWDKNMSICQTQDWPCFSRFRERYQNWCNEHSEVVKKVHDEIESKGPLCSADFDYNEKVGWYYGDTRLSRATLEGMYYSGQLVVHHKKNTRKYYDLPDRHISPQILSAPDPNLTEEQYLDWFVLRRIGSIGMLWNRPSDAWLGIGSFVNAKRTAVFERLLKQKKIIEVNIEEIKYPLYIRCTDKEILMESLESPDPVPYCKILAPLDNLLWDRKLIQELFNFEYRWEVYKPVLERQYGYYVLPVLYGDKLIARFEPEKHRKSEPFIIKNWWWEQGVVVTAEIKDGIEVCLKEFVRYLGASEFILQEEKWTI